MWGWRSRCVCDEVLLDATVTVLRVRASASSNVKAAARTAGIGRARAGRDPTPPPPRAAYHFVRKCLNRFGHYSGPAAGVRRQAERPKRNEDPCVVNCLGRTCSGMIQASSCCRACVERLHTLRIRAHPVPQGEDRAACLVRGRCVLQSSHLASTFFAHRSLKTGLKREGCLIPRRAVGRVKTCVFRRTVRLTDVAVRGDHS